MAQLWARIITGRYSSWLFPSWREEAVPGGVDTGLQLHQGQVSPSSSSPIPLVIMKLPSPSTLAGLHKAIGHKTVPERERGKIWDQPVSGGVLVQEHCSQ